MPSIAAIVEKLVSERPSLEYALNLGVISYSKLATYLLPLVEKEYCKPVSLPAIMVALKRIPKRKRVSSEVGKYELESFSILSPTTCFVFHRRMLNSILGYLNQHNRLSEANNVYLSVGSKEVMVFLMGYGDELEYEKYLKELKPLAVFPRLASIRISIDKRLVNIPGFISYILKEFAWRQINIIDLVSTYTELVIVIKEEDLPESFKLIKSLMEKESGP